MNQTRLKNISCNILLIYMKFQSKLYINIKFSYKYSFLYNSNLPYYIFLRPETDSKKNSYTFKLIKIYRAILNI